jgi:hypothetical protein
MAGVLLNSYYSFAQSHQDRRRTNQLWPAFIGIVNRPTSAFDFDLRVGTSIARSEHPKCGLPRASAHVSKRRSVY